MALPRYKNQKHYFHSCLNTDNYDKRQFENLLAVAPKIQKTEAKGESVFPGYINFMGDQWSALYKGQPQINPEAGGKAALHRPLIQKMMLSEDYQKLREQTTLDDFSAAIGTLSISETMIKYIEERKKNDEQLKEMQNQQEQLQQQIRQNQQSIQKREQQGKKPTPTQQEKSQKLADLLNGLQQQMGQRLANNIDMSQMLSQAAQDANSTKQGIEDLISGTQAGSGAAEMKKIPLRQQLELAEVLKKDRVVRKVAEWAGRFKAIARKKQKSKHVASVEREGIIQGNDPELLLPTELAMLNNPSTKLDFYRRFTEKQTLQYAPQGKDSAGKGPIVLCLDQSGSMDDQKEQAAGFALAIAMIARRQHRDFAYIPFASKTGKTLIFPKGKIPVEGIIEIATSFLDGGTNFEQPLREAIKIVENRERFKNADVIFVTDGSAHLNDEFLNNYHEKKKKLDFKCMGCVLGSSSGHEVEKFTDEWFAVTDLIKAAEDSAVFQI
ncbi:vWA domain-containing protein [Desulfitobacterium hafniense]|uniref:vWA domain-containing protein n=1 Tax=Desulfitobacterium hafniense TaxID=49338 RepID=UPI00036D35B3|nr:VWA domain-containing protein [Desulfitobacterium hafniense]